METGCAQSTTLTAPPSVWALLAFALTTVLCLAFDSSFGFDQSPLIAVCFAHLLPSEDAGQLWAGL